MGFRGGGANLTRPLSVFWFSSTPAGIGLSSIRISINNQPTLYVRYWNICSRIRSGKYAQPSTLKGVFLKIESEMWLYVLESILNWPVLIWIFFNNAEITVELIFFFLFYIFVVFLYNNFKKIVFFTFRNRIEATKLICYD